MPDPAPPEAAPAPAVPSDRPPRRRADQPTAVPPFWRDEVDARLCHGHPPPVRKRFYE